MRLLIRLAVAFLSGNATLPVFMLAAAITGTASAFFQPASSTRSCVRHFVYRQCHCLLAALFVKLSLCCFRVFRLPLFLPGFFLGLASVSWAFRDAALRPAKILLGVFAVTAPVLEWLLMSGLLRSGYGGG